MSRWTTRGVRAAFNDVAPYTHLVDQAEAHPLSFFETVVGMAYAAFADAPVDVAVVEGRDGAPGTPPTSSTPTSRSSPRIVVDHANYLGGTPAEIAREKSGIIKAGSVAVLPSRVPDVAAVLPNARPRSATVAREA